MKPLATMLCSICLFLVLFAAIGGASGGLTLHEAKSLAGLGFLLGCAGVALEERR